jgi:hypothetical protein
MFFDASTALPEDVATQQLSMDEDEEAPVRPDDEPWLLIFGHVATRRRKQAIEYVRGIAEKRSDSPTSTYIMVMRHGEGFAYEVQVGSSGRAYLPSVLEALSANPDARVRVFTSDKLVEAFTNQGALKSLVLPENQWNAEAANGGTKAMLLDGPSKVRGQPLVREGLRLFAVSATLFSAMLVVLLGAAGALALQGKTATMPPPATAVENMPLAQWSVLETDGASYIRALSFANGKWQVIRGPVQPSGKARERRIAMRDAVSQAVQEAVQKIGDTPEWRQP